MKKQRSNFQKGTRTRTTTTTCCTSKKTKLPKAKQLREGGDKKKRKGKTGKTLTECFPIDQLRSITKQLAAKKTKKTKWEKKKIQRQLFAQNLGAQEKV
jgi:hypothetical protein